MARNAQQAGADAVLLFSSPYGSEDAEGAYRYFKDVADAVKIGVILYPRGQEEHWPATIRRLAETPNVIGFKDPSGEIAAGKSLGALVPDDFLWIAEGEEHAVKVFPVGARAYTSAVAVFAPKACRQFWEAGVSGRLDQDERSSSREDQPRRRAEAGQAGLRNQRHQGRAGSSRQGGRTGAAPGHGRPSGG